MDKCECNIKKVDVCNIWVHRPEVETAFSSCPCKICLVKMVCRLQCRERKRYFASVKEEKKMRAFT